MVLRHVNAPAQLGCGSGGTQVTEQADKHSRAECLMDECGAAVGGPCLGGGAEIEAHPATDQHRPVEEHVAPGAGTGMCHGRIDQASGGPGNPQRHSDHLGKQRGQLRCSITSVDPDELGVGTVGGGGSFDSAEFLRHQPHGRLQLSGFCHRDAGAAAPEGEVGHRSRGRGQGTHHEPPVRPEEPEPGPCGTLDPEPESEPSSSDQGEVCPLQRSSSVTVGSVVVWSVVAPS